MPNEFYVVDVTCRDGKVITHRAPPPKEGKTEADVEAQFADLSRRRIAFVGATGFRLRLTDQEEWDRLGPGTI